MKKVVTACTRDCPGACSIIAYVKDHKVVKLRGNPAHEVTDGFLCKNTSNYLKNYFYSPYRILHPLLKEKGKWKQITWNQALNIASEKISKVIEEYGSQAILYYQGFGARTALQAMNKRFFNLLGGVTTTYGTICGGIGHAAMEMDFGGKLSHDPLDHLNSKFIIVWGRNPAVTDVHLWKILKKAQKNGVKIAVIDPVKTKTANQSDIFIQPAPGSDHYLAMALVKIVLKNNLEDGQFIKNYTKNFNSYKRILEQYSLEELSGKCDVDIEKLKKITLIYAQEHPSSIITGWGLHRYLRGHLAFRMIDALAAVTGNIGVSGGGVSQGFEEYEYFDFNLEKEELNKNQRKISMPQIGEAILKTNNPPIKLIFLASGNPVNLNPNSLKVKKAFESVDFIIMIDHFLNDTADTADLFLPSTSFLEEENLIGSYGHNWISPINQVLPPQGETKSEFEIFQLLAQRLGFGDEMAGTPRKWLKKIATPILKQGISFNAMMNAPQKMKSTSKIPFNDRKFDTKSGLFEFIEDLSDTNCTYDHLKKDFPLKFLSTASEEHVGSVVPKNELVKEFLEIQVNPDILERENLVDGSPALLESPVGCLMVKVNANYHVRNDYVLAYKGGWLKHNKCVNVLTEDLISEIGDGTAYYDTQVRLKKLDNHRK
ncbi:MAG: molybdopterin-dependent oxidoreductase [Methanobacteriaceae archaeon]|nr:MAG: trimethylamine-N-oxide reductase [Methanobacterium sp. BRmetb2]MCC7557674.1 molybdopterin-dependent oxidoreductase [Methanobacteriaceae archaeon]